MKIEVLTQQMPKLLPALEVVRQVLAANGITFSDINDVAVHPDDFVWAVRRPEHWLKVELLVHDHGGMVDVSLRTNHDGRTMFAPDKWTARVWYFDSGHGMPNRWAAANENPDCEIIAKVPLLAKIRELGVTQFKGCSEEVARELLALMAAFFAKLPAQSAA